MHVRSNSLTSVGAVCALVVVLNELLAGPAVAKASYVTFDGFATGINSGGTVTGYVQEEVDLYDGFLRAPDGTTTTFAVSETSSTIPASINDASEIVGSYVDASGNWAGFVRASDGTITTFDGPQADFTEPWSVNNRGDITGYYYVGENGAPQGFLRTAAGRMTSFDVSGSSGTEPNCINDKGVITGFYLDSNGTHHGFVRAKDGTFAAFDVQGAEDTYAISINVKGTVAGYYDIESGGGGGFTRTPDGTITTFGEQDCPAPVVNPLYVDGINRKGVITGSCYLRGHTTEVGFVRKADGKIHKFHVPQLGPGTFPAGINDAGEIVGIYNHHNTKGGFLRIP